MKGSRLAVVTGGGRGIGRAIAFRLVSDGIRVALWARTRDEVETVALQIRDAGGVAYGMQVDVSDWDSVRSATDRTREVGGTIDILVNNAAVAGPRGPVAQADPVEWARTINIDLTGPFHCMRAVLPSMIEQRRGKIVNVVGGGADEPLPGNSAYATAKTGLVRLSETVAREVREHNVQVNSITPGPVATRLAEDMARSLKSDNPEEVLRVREMLGSPSHSPEASAELAAFLVSPESDALTGRWLSVYDDWWSIAQDSLRLTQEDLFVLRRNPP